eukprot:4612737-Karenia_brevis.AAC.1
MTNGNPRTHPGNALRNQGTPDIFHTCISIANHNQLVLCVTMRMVHNLSTSMHTNLGHNQELR